MRPIYFDYNATTPVLPPVRAAVLPYLGEQFGNPSSGHAWGVAPKRAVSMAREQVGRLVGADAGQVVFTSCATESINTVLKGLLWGRAGESLIITAVEHPATLAAAAFLEEQGVRVTRVPVDGEGVVDPAAVIDACDGNTALVSVMLANNETGALQPVAEIAAALGGRGIPVHCDASQAVGKIPVDIRQLGVQYLTLAGHKLYAPKGVGALVLAPGQNLTPLLHGGGQEHGLRAGTENVALVAGLGAACALASADLEVEGERQRGLGLRFLQGLERLGADYRLHSAGVPRLPQTLFIGFRGLAAGDLLSGLVGNDVAVSGGAACHGAETTLSHVLEAMATPEEYARGTLRFSWGRGTTAEDVDQVVERLGRVLGSLG
ncbi:MAG TPA: cysteine desulfurase family protein [Deferrisomatales bacterium]|nr:cysteine desulfurase family protein [Deferrisomatales bacterium]